MSRPSPIPRRPFRGFARTSAVTPDKSASRAYSMAMGNRFTGDWIATSMDADSELRGAVARTRNRARDLARNNPYIKRFLAQCVINIVGHAGIKMVSRIQRPDGSLDDYASGQIKTAWKAFSKRGQCSTCRTYSRAGLEAMMVREVPTSGEFFAFRVRGYKNRFGYALRPFEADYCDHELNQVLPNGNEIRMGVEIDPTTDEVVAYWLWARHPGDMLGASQLGTRHLRMTADKILHVFWKERPGQTRGVTWFAPIGERLKILDGYQQAAAVGARAAASKMAAIITPQVEGQPYEGDGEDEDGNTLMEMEPGVIEELPYGKDIKVLDWNNPNGNYGDFVKNVLRGISAGLNVSYNRLAMDLESVNYSSYKAGALDENEWWKILQVLLAVEQFEQPVFEDWLDEAMLLRQVKVTFARQQELIDATEFQGRRWESVDPLKDAQADQLNLLLRKTSLRRIIARDGGDIEDVIPEIEEDQKLAEEHDVSLAPVPPTPVGRPPSAPPDDPDDPDDPEDENQPEGK